MYLLEGRKTAEAVKQTVLSNVSVLAEKGIKPGLKVVLVGENPASMSYVGMVTRSAEKYGVDAEIVRLEESISHEGLLAVIDQLNQDSNTDGILIQLPLPAHIDERAVLEAVHPDKDVDGFHPINVGRLSIGDECHIPCTPYGIYKMLQVEGINLKGKDVVVIGRSNIVGKPAALLMLRMDATVTICHSRTANLDEKLRQADVIIVAIGKKRFLTGDQVKPGAIVIDVGIHNEDGKIVGDVDFDSVKDKVSMITPVPGGVGTTTIAMLMHQTTKACGRLKGIQLAD